MSESTGMSGSLRRPGPGTRAAHPLNPHSSEPGLPRQGVDLAAGDRIGGLVVVRLLGRGGMGAVYEARDSAMGRSVAVKVLDRPAADVVARERFLREARAIAEVRHPHVVEAYHVGQDGDLVYMVLELMRGGSCAALLEAVDLPTPAEATRIIREAAAGLGAAHAAGIVHRDVKPANLMMDEHGTVKVADFGLAKWTEVSQYTLTKSGDTVGTPLFMSPEQCRGEDTDARSDLYSLGAAYYSLLTGEPPFRADHPTGVIFQHLTKPVPDPRRLRADLPEGCRRVIGRAMAKQPNARYRSAAEMIADLAAIDFAPAPVRIPRRLPATEAPAATAAGRVYVWAAASAALLVSLGLGAAALLRQADPLAEPTPVAPAASHPAAAEANAIVELRRRFADLQDRGRTDKPAELRAAIARLEAFRDECAGLRAAAAGELARAAEEEIALVRERLAIRSAADPGAVPSAGGDGQVLFGASPGAGVKPGAGWVGDGRTLTLARDAAAADAGIAVEGPAFADFTMRVGVRWVSTDTDDNRLLFVYRESRGAGFALCWSPSKAAFELVRGNGAAPLLRLRRRPPEGEWTDLVLQVSGRRHRLLVNGQVVGEFEHDDVRPGNLRVWAAGGTVSLRDWRLTPGDR